MQYTGEKQGNACHWRCSTVHTHWLISRRLTAHKTGLTRPWFLFRPLNMGPKRIRTSQYFLDSAVSTGILWKQNWSGLYCGVQRQSMELACIFLGVHILRLNRGMVFSDLKVEQRSYTAAPGHLQDKSKYCLVTSAEHIHYIYMCTSYLHSIKWCVSWTKLCW